jgi:hypothetical protein
MKLGIVIIGIFFALVGLLIFKFEKPASRTEKLTGRGGDFSE